MRQFASSRLFTVHQAVALMGLAKAQVPLALSPLSLELAIFSHARPPRLFQAAIRRGSLPPPFSLEGFQVYLL